MAIPQAPLLSLGASGTIAKTLVYGKWKGRRWVRSYAVPGGDVTQPQARTRNIFGWLGDVWIVAPDLLKAPFDLFAHDKPLYGKNVFIGKNIEILRAGNDINSWLASPGVNYAPPINLLTVNSAPTHLTVIPSMPPTPDGWTFAAKVAACIQTQDPQTATVGTVFANEQLLIGSNVALINLANLTEYAVSAWIRWTRPDGSTAYTRAVNKVATTTV